MASEGISGERNVSMWWSSPPSPSTLSSSLTFHAGWLMPRNNCMHPNQILSTTKIWTDVAHHQDCILSPSPSQWWCTSPPTKICLCVHHHHHHIYIQDRHHHNGGTISMGCDQSLSSTGTTAHRHAHCSANARSCSIRRCLIMRDFAGKSMKLYGVWISLFCDWVFYLWGVSYDVRAKLQPQNIIVWLSLTK